MVLNFKDLNESVAEDDPNKVTPYFFGLQMRNTRVNLFLRNKNIGMTNTSADIASVVDLNSYNRLNFRMSENLTIYLSLNGDDSLFAPHYIGDYIPTNYYIRGISIQNIDIDAWSKSIYYNGWEEQITNSPTNEPTVDPTADPTFDPTSDPTADPTNDPTVDPTTDPTTDPSIDPTMDPTIDPTIDPSSDPTHDPTYDPTVDPTNDPSIDPTAPQSTMNPTQAPTSDPTQPPLMTNDPTTIPTASPSRSPSSLFILLACVNNECKQNHMQCHQLDSAIWKMQYLQVSHLCFCAQG